MTNEPAISITSAKAIKAALLRSKTVRNGDNEFDYKAPNGRLFEVRELAAYSYFLAEFSPLPRVARQIPGKDDPIFLDAPKLKGIMGDPNAFRARAAKILHEGDNVIYSGGGLGVATIYHPSLDAAAEAIAESIRQNKWYEHVDKALLDDPDFQAGLRREEAAIRTDGESQRKALHESAASGEHGIFKGLHSMTGPLADDSKKRILSFLNEPSEANWNSLYSLCVKGGTTVWQAWLQVDPSAPRSKPSEDHWPRTPDADTIRSALRHVAGVDLGTESDSKNDAEVIAPSFR